MCRLTKAKLILVQLEAIQGCDPGQPLANYLTLVNEIFRDAKELAEETIAEEPPKAA